MSTSLKSTRLRGALGCAAAALAVLASSGAWADDDDYRRAPLDPMYLEECGACHVAFPPGLLSGRSWRAVADGLSDHFGTDASLDPETLQAIRRYLDDNAGRRRSDGASGRPLTRITETRWFVSEHRPGEHGLRSDTFSRPEVGSPANCAACHRDAAEGRYGEREIRIPTTLSRR